ncbi:MAG TPA: phosphoglycerate dehydrogenase [Tepidisphaeraceae bacterium]|nr:phosphoglycerate dehydrogenase [Tepidisphaeraceae bacterium]
MRILLSTTSFQDTRGRHHEILENSGFEIVRARGPLNEQQMLELLKQGDGFDGLLNGDDALNARVIDAYLDAPRKLKVIAKYGIGLDSIDVKHATIRKIPVLFTPGVNETTVAEQTIGLMIALAKHFYPHITSVKQGQWKRKTGCELYGKTLGLVGFGRIGKETAKRAVAMGMKAIGFGNYWDEEFANEYGVERKASVNDLLQEADVVSLHTHVTPQTRGMINKDTIAIMKPKALLVNTARGALVNEQDVAEACRSGRLWGYATDVLEIEPLKAPHIFQDIENIIVTPHIGSRTNESVQRQGVRAALNLVNFLNGEKDYVQANQF